LLLPAIALHHTYTQLPRSQRHTHTRSLAFPPPPLPHTHTHRTALFHTCHQFVTEQDLTEGAPAVPKSDVAFFAKEAPPKDGGYLYGPWIDAVFAR
jgi:hypothetical protein